MITGAMRIGTLTSVFAALAVFSNGQMLTGTALMLNALALALLVPSEAAP
jgi:hypothetical protein